MPMGLLQELLNTVSDPTLRHVAIVHIPIGLATLGPIAAISMVLFERHRASLRWVMLVVYSIVAITAYVAAQAGGEAIPRFGALPSEARSTLSSHAALGDWIWVVAAGTAVASACMFLQRDQAARAARWICVVLAIACAGLTGLVGHLGGTFVHVKLPVVAEAESASLRQEVERLRAATEMDERARFFSDRVQPIFAKSCVWCHTTVDGDAAGGLDLTTRAGLLKGGQGGPVVVLGKPEESVLYQSVARTHPVLKMPKRGSKLPDDQIDALARWIRDGCAWPETRPSSK